MKKWADRISVDIESNVEDRWEAQNKILQKVIWFENKNLKMKHGT